jgi:ribosome-binding protein aMBF1 (putative translation factor)
MTTLTLKIQLDETVAQAYQRTRPKEKANLKKQIEAWLSIHLRQQSVENLLHLMDNIGQEAEANGLTEDLIDQILMDK